MIENEAVQVLRERAPGEAVLAALTALLRNDAYLLECDANERSITHRFAAYLQAELPNWHVDCEYNRDGIEPKRIRHLDLDPHEEDTEGQTVFPDVIAHVRGTRQNYLVVEVKKCNSRLSRDIDMAKLAGYKRDLGYEYALFIEFLVDRRAGITGIRWID